MKKQKGQRGQTLLEILLAFSVSVLVLSAVILGITTSLSNVQYTKNQGLANSYAQEGMSVVRKIRDSSWYDFSSLSDYTTNTTYCLSLDSTELTPIVSVSSVPCGPNVGVFSREVRFEHNSSDCSAGIPPVPTPTPTLIPRGSKVTVKVSWSDSKCPSGDNIYCHKVELITCFSSVDLKLTP